MKKGYFGDFGGQFVPELLMPPLRELEAAIEHIMPTPSFQEELDDLLRNFAGRETPLTLCPTLSRDLGFKLWLKREDLLHTGAHKVNNTLGQALLAKRMGKRSLVAETGAGQHGVATAAAAARLGMGCIIYMGAEDVERQAPNVRRMKLLGAELRVDSRNIHAFIIGEHGDSELAVWSEANVSGLALEDFCRIRGQALRPGDMERMYREVRDSAYEIIQRKGVTCYGIAMAVGRIAECIVKNEHAVLPISVVLDGQYGLDGLALSIPSLLGRQGLEEILEIPLSPEENRALRDSAEQMKQAIESLSCAPAL